MSDLREIIKRYENAAKGHGQATEQGDSDNANRAYDDIVDAIKDLKSAGGHLSALATLLEHDDPHVRCWSASHLLWDCTEEAVAVLQDLSTHSGIVGLDATMTLREWENGTLTLP